ncbi:helix-turn-helix domain-containing protein [Calothrix sp. FACHB-156]|nr:helix-turn-helix domain-containing protein [Calothrix sp. FACHB-156]
MIFEILAESTGARIGLLVKILTQAVLHSLKNGFGKVDEMPRLTPERLNGICKALNCQPGELLEYEPDESDRN